MMTNIYWGLMTFYVNSIRLHGIVSDLIVCLQGIYLEVIIEV
jgi:hypothetical protein